MIGPITLDAKCAGARSAGNPHAACDVEGAGNGATDSANRARRGKPWIQTSACPDGLPRQLSTLPLHWRRNRKGGWVLGFKTRKARLRRAIVGIAEWCRRHRHWPVKEQHAALTRRIQGHFNYFGVNGNLQSLRKVRLAVTRAWYKWLRRRSQRTRLNWRRFKDLLRSFPLPAPRICVRIWAPSP
jgi:hypothetical protein